MELKDLGMPNGHPRIVHMGGGNYVVQQLFIGNDDFIWVVADEEGMAINTHSVEDERFDEDNTCLKSFDIADYTVTLEQCIDDARGEVYEFDQVDFGDWDPLGSMMFGAWDYYRAIGKL